MAERTCAGGQFLLPSYSYDKMPTNLLYWSDGLHWQYVPLFDHLEDYHLQSIHYYIILPGKSKHSDIGYAIAMVVRVI